MQLGFQWRGDKNCKSEDIKRLEGATAWAKRAELASRYEFSGGDNLAGSLSGECERAVKERSLLEKSGRGSLGKAGGAGVEIRDLG